MKIRSGGSRLIYADTAEGVLQFARGNMKVSSNTLLFSLPAGTNGTCITDCPGCYAKKFEKLYPNVLKARTRNFNIINKDLTLLEDAVYGILSKYENKISLIRIHEGGDFYSQDYADIWDRIAQNAWTHYGVRTYTHTKTNVNLEHVHTVSGFIYDDVVNYGSYEWVREMSRKYNVPICPVTRGYKEIKCGDGCTICMENSYVLFVKH